MSSAAACCSGAGSSSGAEARPDDAAQLPSELPDFANLELFSTRRPRDLIAGASSGIKSFTKGVVGGISTLVVAPVLGAQQNGWAGFCQGLAQGMVGAIALPVAGAAVATWQIGRGLLNTPEALIERSNGKDWDDESRTWYEYNLETEREKASSCRPC